MRTIRGFLVEYQSFSALEALVRQPIIHQVTDAIHRVLEEGCGGEDDHPERWIHKRDHLKGRNESGQFPGEAEVFERFDDDSGGDVNGSSGLRLPGPAKVVINASMKRPLTASVDEVCTSGSGFTLITDRSCITP